MNHWLERLSKREKRMLAGGVAALLTSGLYAFVYSPLVEDRQRVLAAIQTQSQLKSYLQTIDNEVAALRGIKTAKPEPDNSPSLIGVLDGSSVQMGIKPAIKKLAPESQNKVGLWVERCAFDRLIGWLAMLEQQYGIKADSIEFRRDTGGAGLVSGRLAVSE